MRSHPEQPILGVGAVILDDTRVLLVKRAHEPLKGEWSLPGGAVEVGETLDMAIRREVLEETCLEVSVGPVVEIAERITRDAEGRIAYHFVIVDYMCRPTGGRLQCASDAAAAEWVHLNDLDRYGVSHTAQAVIRKAAALPATLSQSD